MQKVRQKLTACAHLDFKNYFTAFKSTFHLSFTVLVRYRF